MWQQKNGRHNPTKVAAEIFGLDGAIDLASLEASNANVHALWRATDDGADALDVWVPAALVADMRMRDRVPETWALAADVAV